MVRWVCVSFFSRGYLLIESSYFFNQSFQDIFCLFFSFYKGIFSYQDTTCIVLQLFNLFLFIFFFFFFFFQPFIGLGQAIQSLLQVLFQRKGRESYTRYTSRKSYQFGCLFLQVFSFLFQQKTKDILFFSFSKQARRRRRARKSECRYRLIITYFYRRFLFRPIRPWHFVSYRGVFLVFTILIPFLLTNPTRRFLGRLG